MGIRRINHATVVSYAALVIALSTGGAYAVDRFTSRDIENNTIRSVDLKKRHGVAGSDVKRDSLTGAEVREESLNGAAIAPVAGVNDALDCNPISSTPINCVDVSLDLRESARVMVIATGGVYSVGDASAACEVRADGNPQSVSSVPGSKSGQTDPVTTDGFARTLVTPDPLPAGRHKFALACSELSPDVRISTPTIAALAISTGR